MSIKFFYDGECRRVRVDEGHFSYSVLVHYAHSFFPALRVHEVINFHWTDEEGDQIVLSSDAELEEARRLNPSLLRLEITRDNSPNSSALSAVHRGVSCDECGVSPITGVRYKCTVRHDFDLCAPCEARREQPHDMIKIYTPRHKRNRDIYCYADININDLFGHRGEKSSRRRGGGCRRSSAGCAAAAADKCCNTAPSSAPPSDPPSEAAIDPQLAALAEDARKGAFGPHIAQLAQQLPIEQLLPQFAGENVNPLMDLIGQFSGMRGPCGGPCTSQAQPRQSEEERIEEQFVNAAMSASMQPPTPPEDEARLKDPNPAPEATSEPSKDLDLKLEKWYKELDTLYAMGFDDLEVLLPLLEEYTETKKMSTPDALQRIVAELLLRRR